MPEIIIIGNVWLLCVASAFTCPLSELAQKPANPSPICSAFPFQFSIISPLFHRKRTWLHFKNFVLCEYTLNRNDQYCIYCNVQQVILDVLVVTQVLYVLGYLYYFYFEFCSYLSCNAICRKNFFRYQVDMLSNIMISSSNAKVSIVSVVNILIP